MCYKDEYKSVYVVECCRSKMGNSHLESQNHRPCHIFLLIMRRMSSWTFSVVYLTLSRLWYMRWRNCFVIVAVIKLLVRLSAIMNVDIIRGRSLLTLHIKQLIISIIKDQFIDVTRSPQCHGSQIVVEIKIFLCWHGIVLIYYGGCNPRLERLGKIWQCGVCKETPCTTNQSISSDTTR